MKVIEGFENLKKQILPSAVTVGVFDGVHLGHKAVLQRTKVLAKEKNWQSIAVTFDPHPLDVLKPKTFPTVLTSLPLKLKLLGELGVDLVVVIKFTKNFSEIKAEDFITNILINKLNMKAVVVGERFCFGKAREGDVSLLFKLSAKHGFTLISMGKVKDELGHKISSTHIRRLIQDGNLETASSLLGRHPTFIGRVEAGNGRGIITGYPTANVVTQDNASIPKSGVYAGKVSTNAGVHPAVIHIGGVPTFGIKKARIESHIIDFGEILYGKDITITLVKKIREVKKFAKAADLSKQIKNDIEKTKKILISLQLR